MRAATPPSSPITPELDMINYAGPQMPPLFIWHNRDDQFVPVTNPLMIAS